jgi:hypothetical protein
VAQQVFISYKHEDETFALRLYDDLKAIGINVWIDQRDIRAAGKWDRQVEDALQKSDAMILILTPASVGSENVADEWSYYLDEKKPVLPVLFKPCSIPFRLRRVQHIDFTGDYTASLTHLQGELANALNTPAPSASAATSSQAGSQPQSTSSPNPSDSPTHVSAALPLMTLQTLITQPADLTPFAVMFPEMAGFMFQFNSGADPAAIGMSWSAVGCLNVAQAIPAAMARLGWRGGSEAVYSAPNPCFSLGSLHQAMFGIYEFATPSAPIAWNTDPTLRSAYTQDGVFMQINYPNPAFPNSLFGSGQQMRLCPGLVLINGELWVPYGRFLLTARILCKIGTEQNAVWNLKRAGISVMQNRVSAAGLV